MKYHLLGTRTGLHVSALALGTGRLDVGEAPRILATYAEAGGNFLDTSSAYLGGKAEELVGDFLATEDRERFVVSSKYCRTPFATPGRSTIGNHRKAMRAEVEGSLRRLRTDRIDLYFAHFDDGQTPMDEIMRGLDDLVREGKIVFAGLSNFPAWRCATGAAIADLRGWAPLAAIQVLYNVRDRDADRELLPFAREHGLAVMAYSPLGAGTLAKTHSPSRLIAWLAERGCFPVLGARTHDQIVANLSRNADPLDGLDELHPPVLGYPHDILNEVRAAMG